MLAVLECLNTPVIARNLPTAAPCATATGAEHIVGAGLSVSVIAGNLFACLNCAYGYAIELIRVTGMIHIIIGAFWRSNKEIWANLGLVILLSICLLYTS